MDTSRVQIVAHEEGVRIVDAMRRDGWLLLELPSGLVDRSEFFEAVRTGLPMDPPLGRGLKWDALFDSLFEGMRALPNNRIAVWWPNAGVMRDNEPHEFVKAAQGLDDVAEQLSDPSVTKAAPKDVVIVLSV